MLTHSVATTGAATTGNGSTNAAGSLQPVGIMVSLLTVFVAGILML